MGLREEEVCQAARALTKGIPCLALFKGSAAKSERGDMYDLFAEVFIVLQVRLWSGMTCVLTAGAALL